MNLALSAKPSVFVSVALLFAALAIAGLVALDLPLIDALVGAAAACALHWLSMAVHHLGHAAAAARVGHPMTGIEFWGPFGRDVYPADEGDLPARVHVTRALGGPIASALLSLIAGAVWFSFRNQGGWLSPVALLFFLDNLLVLTLQVVLPLGFNDGGTLWKWVPRRPGQSAK